MQDMQLLFDLLMQVWVSRPESAAIAAHLGISTAAFYSEYCQVYAGVPGWRMLQSKAGAVDVSADGVSGCPSLDHAHAPCMRSLASHDSSW